MTINAILKTAEAGLKVGGKLAVKHLPTILTAVGSIAVIFGVVQTAKKAPEAKKEFDQAKAEWDAQPDQEKRDKAVYVWRLVKIGARYYGVICLIVGGAIVCFWVANHINLKRLLAAVAAGKVSADYAKDLENQIKRDGGDKALNDIKDKINAEKIQTDPLPPGMDVSKLNAMIGECPVWDPIMKQWMISSADRIRTAVDRCVNELVQQMQEGEPWAFVPYSDFLEYCGWQNNGPHCGSYDAGSYLGFGLHMPVDVEYTSLIEAAREAVGVNWTAALKDGIVPVLALRYDNPPVYDKNRAYD